jgi:Bacteriophage lambda head decoration protein D/Putative binding domain, N-terminal
MATSQPIARASFSSTPFSYSPLLSDGDDVVSRTGTVASGLGVMKRGTILKMDPATGALTVPVAAVDCNCVLSNDIDATSTAAAATVYVSGKMKADAIIWPGALGHGLCSDALRDYGILIESVVYTDGTLVKVAPSQAEAQAAQTVVEVNRETEAAKAAGPGPTAEQPKPSMDSPWAYLTAEEREKHPELAEVPTAQELGDAVGGIPAVPPVTLSPTSDSMSAAPETSSFRVTMTGPGVSGTWTAEKDVTWLTIVSPTAPQNADGDVTYAVAANVGAMRTGKITVNGKTFTVTQSAGA